MFVSSSFKLYLLLYHVGLFPDSQDIDTITGDIKKRILIGIFGSFRENKPILDELKEFLRTKAKYLNVFTADDFPYDDEPAITEGDAKYGYSYGKSMALVHRCDVAILFFFDDRKDCKVNESTFFELQELASIGKKDVIVLYEMGCDFRSNAKGVRHRTHDVWPDWENFSRDAISDMHDYVKMACHGFILKWLNPI